MKVLVLCLFSCFMIGYGADSPTYVTLSPFGLFFNRLTNTTFGVVRGGLNVLNATVTGIMNRVGNASERIRALIEEFRQKMMMGIPELGVPILEPLTINKIVLNVSNEVVTLKGQLENLEITQLSKFRLDHVHFSLNNVLTLNLTFPEIDVKGYYNINGVFGDVFNIYGDGPFWLNLYELSIGSLSQIRYDRYRSGYYVSGMKLDVKLKRLENNFENLMRDPELSVVINKVITRLGPEVLHTLWPQFEPGVTKVVVKIINQKLKDFELASILGRLINVFKLNLNQGRINIGN